MENKLKSIANQMDAYSDMQVPFAVGSWCRQHKFNTLAVDILRTVKTRNELSDRITMLERQRDAAEQNLKELCALVEEHKLGVAHGV